ncbi:MAG: type II toxin-antitoxin system Phd/YefM family antitoxin [Candidatus Binatia bacterium]
MFEIQDERLGKLKIFNVTEARANFADVLKEPNAKVVVTRHGRPTKILLSYDEFIQLLSIHQPQTITEKLTASEGNPATIPSEKNEATGVPTRWVQRDAEQIVSSLKSLLK